MLYVVTDSSRSYPAIVELLERSAHARVIHLDDDPRVSQARGPSKARILIRLLSPSVLCLRREWGRADRVLVINWHAVPILALVRLGYLRRPEQLVVMGTFVQSPLIRRIVNVFFRCTMIPELEFIAFSQGEHTLLTERVGLPPERVHKLMWGGHADALVGEAPESPYVFTGGYANRDYDTFFQAVRGLPEQVITVASRRNRLRNVPPNVDLRLDIPLDEFHQLLGACHVLVVPLRPVGEASGQSVLNRAIRYGRPVIATRHDGVVDYLGAEYSGYVTPGDPEALRSAIGRVMSDDGYRQKLMEEVELRRRALDQVERNPAQQVLAVLQRPKVRS